MKLLGYRGRTLAGRVNKNWNATQDIANKVQTSGEAYFSTLNAYHFLEHLNNINGRILSPDRELLDADPTVRYHRNAYTGRLARAACQPQRSQHLAPTSLP